MNKTTMGVAAAALMLVTLHAQAAVSAEEAAKLKSELTPFGAEKAGNKDGSIPAWTGGMTALPAGEKPGGRRSDPFKGEKPLYSVTAANVDQHADKLSEGTVAMLKKFPKTFRVDVYKTHRTAAAPQWVYDNTFKNATRAKLNGEALEGAYGGAPFPIPKSGAEVIWNHLTRWQGSSMGFDLTQYQITTEGKAVMTSDLIGQKQFPYYFDDGNLEQFTKSGSVFSLLRLVNAGPPIRVGEALVDRQSTDSSKSNTWVYLTGQRRVRKLPNSCCDTPTPATAGLMNIDELEVFNSSRIDRFDWKLVGKREMVVPYNVNRLLLPKTDAEVFSVGHINPDHFRWELHRVWVVEATLRAGQRHVTPRSRYYCDEDTWMCVLGDRWDANGQLWRTLWGQPMVAADLPAVIQGAFGYTDLLSGAGFVANLFNSKAAQIDKRPRFADSDFTPEAMTAGSAR